MGPIRRRLPAASTLGVLVGSGLVATTLSAPPAAAVGCDVPVVVDFTGLPNGPGTTLSGCADAPGSGLEALDQAGFTPSVGSTELGDVVCDIDGAPGTNCAEGGLWSYWELPPGSAQWKQLDPASAATRTPVAGTVEGWSYQTHPDVPAAPPAFGPPTMTTDPTSPPPVTDPTTTPATTQPTSDPTTSPTVPPGGTSSGGGTQTTTSGPGAAAPGPPSVQPPGLGGSGGGTTGTDSSASGASGSSGSAGSSGSSAASGTTTSAGTSDQSNSGVLGMSGGSPLDRELRGPAAAGLGVDQPAPEASPWLLILCGALLASVAAAATWFRHRLRSERGRHS